MLQGFQELKNAHGRASTAGPERRLHFHFLCNPVAATASSESHISHISLQPQKLQPGVDSGRQSVVATGEAWALPVDMLLRSVGYRGKSVPGIPFDSQRAIVPNTLGRVYETDSGETVPGLYVAGWIKRGPQGIIGTNLVDAEQTARCVAEDLGSLAKSAPDRLDIAKALEVCTLAARLDHPKIHR